jgi:hypothetical protein
MPSPFAGMDPYLEEPDTWPDFHGTFLMCLRAELNRILPKGYVARWDRHVWIDEPESAALQRLGKPDVFVSDAVGRDPVPRAESVVAAPATATLPEVDPRGKPFVKILDVKTRRVVTVVELLSPANKSSGKDRDAYLAKRQEYLRGGTDLVEMDFLRTGTRPPVEGPRPAADYYIIISRAVDYPRAGIWPLRVQEPLPPIPVPLYPQDEPVWLALRPCMDRAFAEGRLDEDIDYDSPPVPPLDEPDATWARERLARRPA